MAHARRLNVLRAHLAGPDESHDTDGLQALYTSTSASRRQEEGSYCVVLPEKLTSQGPWLVRRFGFGLLCTNTCVYVYV
jgi:hypothetical protein